MTDPADRFLEEKLHGLARGVSVPIVPTEDDVRRGRRRLFRMRVAMAGATTGTLAVVLGVTSLTAGDPNATETPQMTQPPSTSTSAPTGSPDTGSGEDDESGAGRPGGTGDNKGVGLTDPGIHQTGDGEAPAKNATDDTATGGTTQDGSTIGPTDRPSTDGPDPTEEPSPTATPSATPSDTPTSTPTDTPTTTVGPTVTPTATPTTPPTQTPKVRVHRVLRYYNDVLAEHLDPEGLHLEPYDRTIDPKETTRLDGRLYVVGSSYRWQDGRSRAGLDVTVASGWDMVPWECGATDTDWDCRIVSTGTPGTAEVAQHDGRRAVAVEHADGQVVVVEADLDEKTIGEADLVAGAADDRLILPGDAPVAPPALDSATFAEYGEAALVRDGETFTQTALDRTPFVRGTWAVDGIARGTLSWSAEPIYSDGSWVCLTTYRSCTDVEVEVDGSTRTVHLARLKKRFGGGWLVQYDGPSYAVRVTSTDPKFPKKRAYIFVNDADWQTFR